MTETNAQGVDMRPFWFVSTAHRDLIFPGDVVSLIGFRQYIVRRSDEQIAFGNVRISWAVAFELTSQES